jgi:hypothetical protein
MVCVGYFKKVQYLKQDEFVNAVACIMALVLDEFAMWLDYVLLLM